MDLNAKVVPAGRRDSSLLAEVVTITPREAAKWLEHNKANRPLTKNHVLFLANELKAGHWRLNGQAIIIAEDESILDGQHRLHAIIESGIKMTTMVVYGVDREAFTTMDTGKVRSPGDTLCLHYPDAPVGLARNVGTATSWSLHFMHKRLAAKSKVSNTDILAHVAMHPELWRTCEILTTYPRPARPLPIGVGGALYAHFLHRDNDQAEQFMRDLYTGLQLTEDSCAYVLRSLLQKDAQRVSGYPMHTRVKMTIKAWNLYREGKPGKRQRIQLHWRDSDWIDIR